MLKNANIKNIKLIASSINSPISVQEMANIIDDATSEEFDVCIIDLVNRSKMFRKNFDEFY